MELMSGGTEVGKNRISAMKEMAMEIMTTLNFGVTHGSGRL